MAPKGQISARGHESAAEHWNNVTPLAEGHWKMCRLRAKHYVARGSALQASGGIMGAEGDIMWPEGSIFPEARGQRCDIDNII